MVVRSVRVFSFSRLQSLHRGDYFAFPHLDGEGRVKTKAFGKIEGLEVPQDSSNFFRIRHHFFRVVSG